MFMMVASVVMLGCETEPSTESPASITTNQNSTVTNQSPVETNQTTTEIHLSVSSTSGNPAIIFDDFTGGTTSQETSDIKYNDIGQIVSYNFTSTNSNGKSHAGSVFNIQRSISGVTISYNATIDGKAYQYP